MLFGREYKRLHEAIDYPVKVFGRGHRRFFHTTEEAVQFAMTLYPWDRDAMFSGRMHIWVDWECSRDKKFKRLLESEAKKDEKWRKNPWKIFERKVTREDLLHGYLLHSENEPIIVDRKSCFKRKKRKKIKKKDEFWEILKRYKWY
ncbi:MAG: hypothetical protein QCH99_08365 [Candidatus Bathyarchaeota archaeon]|nr:hypothetical protein [Candidatus Bathyarchaeum tardum]